MPSLADIPTELLNPLRFLAFANWVFKYPLDWPTTKALFRLWSHYTDRPITGADWSAIQTRWSHRNAHS